MLLLLVASATALLIIYCYTKLRYKRFRQYADFPQMPSSLILGHLKIMTRFIRTGKPNGHPGRFHNPPFFHVVLFLAYHGRNMCLMI